MRSALVLLPLLLVIALCGPALADDDAYKTKKAKKYDTQEVLEKKRVRGVHFDEVPVKSAVQYVVTITGLNVVVPPDVEGTVTLKLDDVSVKELLDAICDQTGLELHVADNGIIKLARKGALKMKGKYDTHAVLDKKRVRGVHFDKAPVKSAVQYVVTITGLNVILPPDAEGRVTLKMDDVSVRELLAEICEQAGLELHVGDANIVKLARRGTRKKKGKRAAYSALQKEISVHFENAPVKDVLEYIAAAAGLNLIIPPDVESKVTVRFKEVPASKILHYVADHARLDIHHDSGAGVLKFTKRSKHEKRLRYFDLRDLVSEKSRKHILKNVKRLGKGMTVEEKNGILIVRGTPEELKRVDEALHVMRQSEANQRATDAAYAKQLQNDMKALSAHIDVLKAALVEARKEGDMKKARDVELALADANRKLTDLADAHKKKKAHAEKAAVKKYRDAFKKIRDAELARKKAHEDEAHAAARAAKTRAESLKRKVEELHKKAEHYEQRGDHAKARALLEQAREYMARAEKAAGAAYGKARVVRGGAGGKAAKGSALARRAHSPEHKNAMERLEHLRLAYRSLMATGMREQAEQVGREIREMEERLHHAHRGAHGEHGDVLHAIRALQEEVHGLRAEVQMLTALVKKLLPKREPRRRGR